MPTLQELAGQMNIKAESRKNLRDFAFCRLTVLIDQFKPYSYFS